MGNTGLGKFWSKMTGEPPRNRIAQNRNNRAPTIRTPLLSNNIRSNKTISNTSSLNRNRPRTNEINVIPNQGVREYRGPAIATGSQAIATGSQVRDTQSLAARPNSRSEGQISQPQQSQPNPLTEAAIKLLECKIYEDFFKKTKNIKQIHQRHATTCANVLNKGLDCSAKISLPTTICTMWDIKELAPNTSLTGIGIQQCMQVSDFLLYCKSKNVDYITSQKYSSIEDLKLPITNSTNLKLRPMVIFCCSELLRTQQTLFISYFDIIKDYLKNGRKVIVLFWLNELHFRKFANADNFVVSLAHTKQQWKYFIKRIKNLEFDKNFMEDIGREVEPKIKELSEKLKLETTSKLNYEEWEDIFYVSPVVYFNNPAQNRLLSTFSFDNRRFFSKQTVKGKTLFNPEELYKVLPRILAEYISRVGIIRENNGVGFYEEELSQNVEMNLVFVSHHNSCEYTLKYLTGGQSKENVFNKQQLMNGEIVILPKSGILWSQEYSSVFTDNDFKVDNIATVNIVKKELNKIKESNSIDPTIKTAITTFFRTNKLNTSNSTTISVLQQKLSKLNKKNNLAAVVASNVPAEESNISAAQEQLNTLRRVILYIKYLTKQQVQQVQQKSLEFTLENRIFPVGFYNNIINRTVERKNKKNQNIEIYPLFILYNSLLGIFFTPLDVVKQEVAIINPQSTQGSQIAQVNQIASVNQSTQNGGAFFGFGKKQSQSVVENQGQRTGIQASSQIFSLSSPFGKFLDMSLEEYITFLGTFKNVLTQINKMYNPQQSVPNVLPGVASAAVERPKGNTYFYDYAELSDIVDQIKEKISTYNKTQENNYPILKQQKERNIMERKNLNNDIKISEISLIPAYKEQTLIDYLRENFDTKTLVHNFGQCLFDFCATTEPARNKLRKIVREKLKLEIVEKDYKDIFSLEVQRQLQKFIDDYEKESGFLSNNSPDKVIPVSKGLFSTIKESKKQILEDINKIKEIRTTQKTTGQKLHDFIEQFVSPLLEIYKKYNIIDNSLIQKINSLRTKSEENMSFQQGENFKKYKNEKFKEITEMLRPYQKKFLDSIINKNTRHKNGPKNEKIQNKNKQTVDITNTTTPLKKSKYIVIKNKNNDTAKPVNYIKYQNIPLAQKK